VKLIKYADFLLSMLKTVVVLNIFEKKKNYFLIRILRIEGSKNTAFIQNIL